MRSLVIVLSVCLLINGSVIGQVSKDNAPGVMKGIAAKHQVWGPKSNSPGVSIRLREVGRSSPRIWYEITALGFPPGGTYTIVQWPANKLTFQQMMTGVTLDASGVAICAGTPGTCKGSSPNAPIHFQVSPYKSEPVRLALVSDDEKHLRAAVNFVPIPNQVTDKNCTVESVMLAPNSALVAIQGSGFKPNSELTFLSESEGEHHDGSVTTDANGNLFLAMGLGIEGKDKGTTTLSIISPQCSLLLKVPWGKDSYER